MPMFSYHRSCAILNALAVVHGPRNSTLHFICCSQAFTLRLMSRKHLFKYGVLLHSKQLMLIGLPKSALLTVFFLSG